MPDVNKQITLQQFISSISPGESIAFGGGGLQRKPMAAVKAVAMSGLRDLHLVSYVGGPDADLLLGLKRVRRLEYAYVGFDAYGLSPNFRRARESEAIEAIEYSEATMMLAFEAGAKNLPFQPCRFGLGTDLMNTSTSPFRAFPCPLTGETLVAVPALRPDIAVVHVNVADRMGDGLIQSDTFVDQLLVRAARRTYLTAERVVDRLPGEHPPRSTIISRLWVDGVIEAPRGAGMTAMFPEYRLDLAGVLNYQKNATDQSWLEAFAAGDQ